MGVAIVLGGYAAYIFSELTPLSKIDTPISYCMFFLNSITT